MKLDKEDLDAIASAVVAKFKAEGGTVAAPKTDKPAGTKPADKPKTTKPKGPKREDVLAKIRELGEAKGKPAAKEQIAAFAETFGEVPDEKLGELLAAVEAALAGDEPEAPAAEDDF